MKRNINAVLVNHPKLDVVSSADISFSDTVQHVLGGSDGFFAVLGLLLLNVVVVLEDVVKDGATK